MNVFIDEFIYIYTYIHSIHIYIYTFYTSLIIYDLLEVPPGAPWGGPPAQTTPNSKCARWRSWAFSSLKTMSFLMSIFGRLGLDLGSLLELIFGHVGALVGQSWSQSRLRTVLTSKKWFFKKTSAAEGESTILRSKSAQDGTQDGPRSPQDGSKIVLDRFFSSWFFASIFDRFRIDFGAVLASNMEPQNTAELCKSALGGSKTVLGSSWFGPFIVLSFGIAFLVVLGSFWGRFWALCGSVWCFFGISTHRFNPSTQQLVDATHQLINLSTHQPMALRHFLTRPGGLRAARLE